jgi:hypothetical protein
MQEEHLFRIEAGKAFAATPMTLTEAGLKEREDLQEWIIEHPEILGEDVLIVTFEFDRWLTNAGQSQADRLDVLGIDSSGHLLVVELKRDKAPDTVEMQALKYAAMASRFTPETLASQHARFLTRRGKVTSDSEALELLAAHVSELSIENLREPRLLLMARDFPPTVTATCVWLAERGLDITLLRFQAYRSEDQVLLTTSQLYPVPDVEEFMISPRQAEVKQSGEVKQKTQDVGAVRRLVDNSVIQDGTELTLVLGPGVNTEMRDTIDVCWESSKTSGSRPGRTTSLSRSYGLSMARRTALRVWRGTSLRPPRVWTVRCKERSGGWTRMGTRSWSWPKRRCPGRAPSTTASGPGSSSASIASIRRGQPRRCRRRAAGSTCPHPYRGPSWE